MSLLGSLVNMLGSGSQGQGDNLALINAVVRMLANDSPSGGLGGLAAQLQRAGLGDVVGSWIGRGQNMPISPDQLEAGLGADTIAQIARQLGLDNGDVAGRLSQVLPHVVDALTPDGHVPSGGLGSSDDLLARLGPH